MLLSRFDTYPLREKFSMIMLGWILAILNGLGFAYQMVTKDNLVLGVIHLLVFILIFRELMKR